jgi:hypothetical protein
MYVAMNAALFPQSLIVYRPARMHPVHTYEQPVKSGPRPFDIEVPEGLRQSVFHGQIGKTSTPISVASAAAVSSTGERGRGATVARSEPAADLCIPNKRIYSPVAIDTPAVRFLVPAAAQPLHRLRR